MVKLKLGSITDDKPVKVSFELPATVHRDLGSGEADSADDRAIHGDRPRILEGATRRRTRAPTC